MESTVMVKLLFCLFNRHTPPGRRADWDGHSFVSRCARCRSPIRRAGKGRWRKDTADAGDAG